MELMQKQNAIKKLAVICVVIVLTACSSAEQKKSQYMQQGMSLFQEGRYEKALLAFKNVLQIDPKDSGSRYQLAETLAKQGDMKQAFSQYKAVVAYDEHHVMSRIRVGQLLLMSQQIENAEKIMQEVGELAPDNSEALLFQAAIYLTKNKIEDALASVDRVLQRTPELASAIMMRASINARAGEIKHAVNLLKKGVASHPENEAMHLMLVKFYEKQQFNSGVEVELNTLIKLKPDSLSYYKGLAAFYLRNEEVDKAEVVLRTAIEKMPGNEGAQFYLIDFLAQKYSIERAIEELTVLMSKPIKGYALHFKLVDLQVRKKDLRAAEATLKEIMALDGVKASGIKARNRLATIYAATERVNQAKELMRVVLEENPRDAEALTLRGRFSFADKNISDAIADFRSALVGQPKNIQLLKLLSAAQVANNDGVLAIENLRQVVSIKPSDVKARQKVVELLFRSGKPLQAEADILAILKLVPNDIKTLEALFNIRIQQKEWAKAQLVSETVRQIDGNLAKGYYLSGLAYQAETKWSESVEAFKQVVRLKPESIEPLTQMIKSYLLLDKSEQALVYLNKLVKKQSRHFVAYNLLGEVFMRNEKFNKAEEAFRQAIDIKPGWFNVYRNLAVLFMINKDKAAAIDILQSGIEKTKGSMELIDFLVALYSREGANNEIIKLYEQAFKQSPESDVVVNNLVSYLAEYGGTHDALARAAKLAVPLEKSSNPNILDTVAWVAYKQERYDKAQRILEAAINLGTKNAEIKYHLGMVYYKQGNNELAKNYLEMAVLNAADYKGIAQAKEILHRLKQNI